MPPGQLCKHWAKSGRTPGSCPLQTERFGEEESQADLPHRREAPIHDKLRA